MERVSGVLLDSTFLVQAERNRYSPYTVFSRVQAIIETEQVVISTVSVMELSHGEARADSSERAHQREWFLTSVLSCVQIVPVTTEIARRALPLDGQLRKSGVSVATADLLIGTTALEMGFSV